MAVKDAVYVATDSAIVQTKGNEYVIVKGKRYPGNHPAVRHAPALFETGSLYDQEIEQATAAPGERRA